MFAAGKVAAVPVVAPAFSAWSATNKGASVTLSHHQLDQKTYD